MTNGITGTVVHTVIACIANAAEIFRLSGG